MDPILQASRPLSKEEFEAVSKDLTEVLTKHEVDLSVRSEIQLTKRIPPHTQPAQAQADDKSVPSPFMPNPTDAGPETTTEGPTA